MSEEKWTIFERIYMKAREHARKNQGKLPTILLLSRDDLAEVKRAPMEQIVSACQWDRTSLWQPEKIFNMSLGIKEKGDMEVA